MAQQPDSAVRAIREAVAERPKCIWVLQTGEHWFLDPRDEAIEDDAVLRKWGSARYEIDSVLLEALFRGDVGHVRRAVLYDVSSDAGERVARHHADNRAAHQRIYTRLAGWKEDLARYVALFDDGTGRYPLDRCTAPLSVQELILGRVTSEDEVDKLVYSGDLDGCIVTDDLIVPELWARVSRMISLDGHFGLPPEDADPLEALPALELSEYRRR